jgi:acyl-CoA thioesterase-1
MGLLAAAAAAACLVASDATPALGADAGGTKTIVAFGDSLTAGLGVPIEDAYPARLERRLRAEGYNYRVVNAGVSGDTTAGGLRRVDWALRRPPGSSWSLPG